MSQATSDQQGNIWNGNNVDWNNAITGSPANTIDLNLDEVKAGLAVTNAVHIPAGEKNEQSSQGAGQTQPNAS